MLPSKRLQKSNTIENLWIYILTLAKKRPVYAYTLQKEIEDSFSFRPGRITSYRVLYRLEANGLVKSKTKEKKRIYKITKKGRNELKTAMEVYRKLLNLLIKN